MQIGPTSKLRLLLIEDDEEDYLLLNDMLSDVIPHGQVIDWINTYSGSLEVIRAPSSNGIYDVCLVDYQLGEGTGLDVVREAIKEDFQVPIILLTGQGSYEIDLKAMRYGVSDYLDKSELTPRLLERSIRYTVEHRKLERELLRYQESLERLVEERTKELVEERNRLHLTNLELTEAMANVKVLQGLLPVCAWCKKIRNDEGYWMQLEAYFGKHSLLTFTHGICPECKKKVQDEYRS